ncbi:hypothetical protein HAX54_011923 [Datura stramonium]|uniref:Uncharacterized protein n=1 Tax=Datura stramonium TaxID=4076 RepID=A0ABS8TKS2_DATST|nr:hypothetical protein [Datura stramonium]
MSIPLEEELLKKLPSFIGDEPEVINKLVAFQSVTIGVPIAAWPMYSEQPINYAFFVTEMLKIGLLVREWEKCDELVTASTIENVVRKLMESEDRDEIRKRAEELGASVKQSAEKRGAYQLELDSFIAHITR